MFANIQALRYRLSVAAGGQSTSAASVQAFGQQEGAEGEHRIFCSECACCVEVAMSGEPVARRRYYSPFEVTSGHPNQAGRFLYNSFADSVVCLQVSQHNAPQDCWVSILGQVFDITPLVKVHGNNYFGHSVHKLARTGSSTLLAQFAGSAGHCCSTFGSSCWHRHLALVHAMLSDLHSSGVHIPALLTWPTLSGSMPRLVTSSFLWTH